MTDNALQDALYDWTNQVLNIDGGLGITIIRGEENARPPDLPYIVIHQPLNTRKVGRTNIADTTDDMGLLDMVSIYESVVSIEAVGAGTDYLRKIIESAEKQSIKELLSSLGFSVLRHDNLNPIPDMTENKWEIRSIVDIYISHASGDTDETDYISDVDYTDEI